MKKGKILETKRVKMERLNKLKEKIEERKKDLNIKEKDKVNFGAI